MGLFDFLKPPNRVTPKTEIHNDLTGLKGERLLSLIKEIEDLEVLKNHDKIQNPKSRDFIIELTNDLISNKYPEYDKRTWIQEPGLLFSKHSLAEKEEIIEIIEPVRCRIEKYLKSLVTNYDKLIEDVQRHKILTQRYMDARRKGGHVNQNREFIGVWIDKIGMKWYNLAHLICEFNNEMYEQSTAEKDNNNQNFKNSNGAHKMMNLDPSKLPSLLEEQLREFVTNLIKDEPLIDSPFGGMYIMKIISNWSDSMKEAGFENTFNIQKSQFHAIIDKVSEKVLNELVEF